MREKFLSLWVLLQIPTKGDAFWWEGMQSLIPRVCWGKKITIWETWVQSLGWEDPLEKETAIHSSTLAWKILWMEEPGRLPSTGSQRVRHDWATSLSYFIKHLFLWKHLILPTGIQNECSYCHFRDEKTEARWCYITAHTNSEWCSHIKIRQPDSRAHFPSLHRVGSRCIESTFLPMSSNWLHKSSAHVAEPLFLSWATVSGRDGYSPGATGCPGNLSAKPDSECRNSISALIRGMDPFGKWIM